MTPEGILSGAGRQEVLPPDEREQMVDRAARAVYAKRPFRTAATRSPWDAGEMEAMRFDLALSYKAYPRFPLDRG